MKINLSILLALCILILCVSCNNQPANSEQKSKEKDYTQSTNQEADAKLLQSVEHYIANIENDFVDIPEERKTQLKEMTLYIVAKSSAGEKSNLIFICTHNSRRSHMSQIWAQTAAFYYGVKNVYAFSGGTEATAFNYRSVRALRKAGFEIEQTDSTTNPVYMVKYAEGKEAIKSFSKKYDDEFNPQDNFVAIMTCSHADETCPLVKGASLRVSIPYVDPKEADNTPEEEARYDERCRQIATEMFYIFSQVKMN